MSEILIVFGTRPEFIKLLPVFHEIRRLSLDHRFRYLFTGQHDKWMDELFRTFDFTPSRSIPFRDHHHSLCGSFSYILEGIQNYLDSAGGRGRPVLIMGQGDTTTCACAALCAFFNHIPFAHVEAGLRTGKLRQPFPEEYYRLMITRSADIHFAPTPVARENLLNEGVQDEHIIITGNTIVDAVRIIGEKVGGMLHDHPVFQKAGKGKVVLITCHRRESREEGCNELLQAVYALAEDHPELQFVWPSHLPSDQKEAGQTRNTSNDNLHFIQPLKVTELYALYPLTRLIITDSGGIQEEAPSFSIPVLLVRNESERMESVDLGYAELCGLQKEKIIGAFKGVVSRPVPLMVNPFGKGDAAEAILKRLQQVLRSA